MTGMTGNVSSCQEVILIISVAERAFKLPLLLLSFSAGSKANIAVPKANATAQRIERSPFVFDLHIPGLSLIVSQTLI